MSNRSKVTLQIAFNLLVTILLLAFVIFKTRDKMGWDGSIVVLSMLVNIIILYRSREARKLTQ